MANNDPLSEVISVGYALLTSAARIRRDLYAVSGLLNVSNEEKLAVREHYGFPPASFVIELEALEFKTTMEALEAVEGKAE